MLREGVAAGGDAATACGPQLQAVVRLQAGLKQGETALDEGAFTKAKSCLQSLVAGGVSQSTAVLLLLARAHLALKENVEAAREALTKHIHGIVDENCQALADELEGR